MSEHQSAPRRFFQTLESPSSAGATQRGCPHLLRVVAQGAISCWLSTRRDGREAEVVVGGGANGERSVPPESCPAAPRLTRCTDCLLRERISLHHLAWEADAGLSPTRSRALASSLHTSLVQALVGSTHDAQLFGPALQSLASMKQKCPAPAGDSHLVTASTGPPACPES